MNEWIKSIILIALGAIVPLLVLAPPRKIKQAFANRRERAKLVELQNKTLLELKQMLAEIGGDVRCLYQVQAPQMEAIEVTLETLQGKKMNGNVKTALEELRKARTTINSRLGDKVGCGVGEM
ncbi:MAG TPA: hypothetical protein PKL79_09090 [Rectinema sp.]|nr:hypothetical protein [Rectinema sp.]